MNPAEENEVRRILERKLCTQEQVDEALGIQEQMRGMGLRPRSIAEVLCEKGYLEATDLEAVQREESVLEGSDPVPGYEILERIGRGAMGSVYKARQLSLDRQVALKVLDGELAADEAHAQKFLEEARAVARLSHTNLISGIDVGETGSTKYLVLEYADGVTLSRVLRRGGALDEERALLLALQAARALEYVHKNGFVHADVRPENLMITTDGVTKLLDLGIARRPLVAGEEDGDAPRRTPDYLSPEQARGLETVGPAADLYGLGATLFHMVAGRVPFPAENRDAVLAKHLLEAAPPLRSLAPEASATTEAIVERCLRKAPADRHASASDLVLALEEALAGVQQARGAAAAVTSSAAARPGRPAPPPTAGPGVAPRTRRRRRR